MPAERQIQRHKSIDGMLLQLDKESQKEDVQKLLQEVRVHRSNFTAKESREDIPGETKHTSWFERMSDAFGSVIAGLIMIWFSLPIMWINERRNARMESLIKVGGSECTTTTPEFQNSELRGTLVHVPAGHAHGAAPMQDDRFRSVCCDSGILMIKSVVQVFQWTEQKHEKKTKDNIGGGTTKKSWYTYETEWSSTRIDSGNFHEAGHNNVFPVTGLVLGNHPGLPVDGAKA